MKIAVLAGGNSTEREISIVSGTGVARALKDNGHEVLLMDVFTGECGLPAPVFSASYDIDAAAAAIRSHDGEIEALSRDPRRAFFGEGVLDFLKTADVVFLALHGANGEDGRVQATLDLMKIPYTGSGPLGSAIAMNKSLTKYLLSSGGVATAPWFTLEKEDYKKALADDPSGETIFARLGQSGFGLPAVVKVNAGGSSVGVFITDTKEEYFRALAEAFEIEDTVITERYVKGREFSVGVLNGHALPVIEIAPISGFYDYKNKYTPGSTIETCPADIPEEAARRMRTAAEEGFRILRLGAYGRLDFLMEENGDIYCLEANTLPGMTPTSLLPQEAAAEGMDFGTLCETLIRISLA